MIESARPHTPSMVEDIREGRTSEVGQLNRQVIAHGERTGVATPTHRVVTALIDAFDWRVFRRKPAQRPPLA
jgi:ketopantoate reductase